MNLTNAELSAASERASALKKAYRTELMSKANVVGVGVGFQVKGGQQTDTVALVVMVDQKVPESQLAANDLIPREIEGFPVDVQEVGEVRAL